MSSVERQNRDINSLQPVAKRAAALFLEECKDNGIDIFVTEYHRSQDRQNWLYEQGRSRDGTIVTWTKKSNHTSGYAWDIACSRSHDLYNRKVISKAGEVAARLGIEWGGTWKEQDTPHFQVSKNWVSPYEKEEVNKIKVKLNGEVITVESINCNGNNYIKLRDLADSKISIDYDGMPIITVNG